MKNKPPANFKELMARRRRREPCRCAVCNTTRKYKHIISKLPEKERQWMDGFYESAFEQSAELQMLRAYYEEKHD